MFRSRFNKYRKLTIFILVFQLLVSSFFFSKVFGESAYGVFSSHVLEVEFQNKTGLQDMNEYFNYVDRQMQDLGAKWTRLNLIFQWSLVEPIIGGGYDWDSPSGGTDTLINAIYKPGNDIDLLAVIHPWRKDGMNALTNPIEYARFVNDLAERFDGDGLEDIDSGAKVDYFQLVNEIDQISNRDDPFTLAQYVHVANLTLSSLRASNPDAKLVLVAQISANEVIEEMESILQIAKNAGIDFHAVDLHWWGDDSQWQAPVVADMRSFLGSLGLDNVEIWSTENGTYSGCPNQTIEQSEADQARSLIKRAVYGRAKGLDRYFWNKLIDFYQFKGFNDSVYNTMGLISDGEGSCDDSVVGQRRQAYYSYQKLIQYTDLDTAILMGEIQLCQSVGPCDAYGFEWINKLDGSSMYILWKEGDAEIVELDLSGSRIANIIPLVSENLNGSQGIQVRVPDYGILQLKIDTNPILVIANPSTITQN